MTCGSESSRTIQGGRHASCESYDLARPGGRTPSDDARSAESPRMDILERNVFPLEMEIMDTAGANSTEGCVEPEDDQVYDLQSILARLRAYFEQLLQDGAAEVPPAPKDGEPAAEAAPLGGRSASEELQRALDAHVESEATRRRSTTAQVECTTGS